MSKHIPTQLWHKYCKAHDLSPSIFLTHSVIHIRSNSNITRPRCYYESCYSRVSEKECKCYIQHILREFGKQEACTQRGRRQAMDAYFYNRGGADLNFERHVRAHMVYYYRTFTMDFTMLFTIIVINSLKSVQNSNFYNINKNATLALQKALHICRITT